MELRQVRHFVAVVDHKGVSSAARELFIAQPSLSQSIAKLESDLGVKLFDRAGGRFELTAAGRVFLPHARQLVDDLDAVSVTARQLRAERERRVVIAALGTLAIDPLPGLLALLGEHGDDLEIKVEEFWSHRTLAAAVRSGAADAGLTELRTAVPGLSSVLIGVQQIVVAYPEGQAPPAGVTDLATLASIDMVAPPSDVGEGIAPRRMLRGHSLNVVVECADWDGVIQAVRQGVGATLIARPVAERFFGREQICKTEPPIMRDVGVLYRSDAAPRTATLLASVARSMNSWAGGVKRSGANTST